MDVHMIEPVPYSKVRGVGFYRQFLNTEDWGGFMTAGREQARKALDGTAGRSVPRAPVSRAS
jgi:NTE family protein